MNPPAEPLRYSQADAARLLNLTQQALGRLLDSADNPFTVTRASGKKGPGRRVFIPADEIEAYATSADPSAAVRAVQEAAGRPVVLKPQAV